jgi:hypothetical protein
MDKEKIRKEAQDILDKFSRSLSKIQVKQKDFKDKLGGFRVEGSGLSCEGFRENMFANAPKKEGDFIMAEVKKW